MSPRCDNSRPQHFRASGVKLLAACLRFLLVSGLQPRVAGPSFGHKGWTSPIFLIAFVCSAACMVAGLHAQETINVNVTQARQEIYGFGAGMKRQTDSLRDMPEPARTEILNLMFRDVNTRILRTYLRHNHEITNDNSDPAALNPGALTWGAYNNDIWVYQQALAIAGDRLDTLYASCNTAPAWMKDNSDIVGGSLTANTNTYNEFAEQIWGYIHYMKTTHEMDIRAVSIFNEPGYEVSHDSMNPSPTQAANILSVVGNYLDARFAENPSFTPAMLVSPDGHNPPSTISYLNAALANSGAAAAMDIVGSHYYGGSASDWTTMASSAGNRMLWQTEYATLSGASDDISEGLAIAGRIHDVLAAGGHAYVAFQWVVRTDSPETGNGLIRLLTDGTYVVPKRYHIFKQWANSVPPGSVRLSTSTTTSGLKITAYRTPDNRTVVIQVINDGAGNKNSVVFNVAGASGNVQRTRTSSTLNAGGLSSVPASNGTFTDTVFTNTMTTYLVPVHASHLTGLTLGSGTLSPVFAGGTFAYTATVSTPSITVTPTLAGATITVNGSAVTSGTASAAIPLALGANTITVVSTASGGTSTYTLTVTRTQSSYNWAINQAGPSSWDTVANWTPNTGPPNGIDIIANLTNNITTDNQISLASPVTIGGLNIGDASGDNAFTVASGQPITFDVSTGSATLTRSAAGASPDTINAALVLADTLAVNVTTATGSLALNGDISQTGGGSSLNKSGAGTLILSGNNSYTGATRISGGILQVATLANTGSSSNIGASTNEASNLTLNGGTLRYTGAAVSTNRRFALQTSSSIDASGAGAVNFTNTAAMGFNGGTADKTLTLTGDNTGANILAASIGDNVGVTSLAKSGTGTWVVSGANTYTGSTVITDGTLRLANTAAVQNSSLVSINGVTNDGILQLATNTAFSTFPLFSASSTSRATIVSDRATAGAGLTHLLGVSNFGVNTYNFTSGANVTSGTGGVSFSTVNLTGGGNGSTIFNPTTANLTIADGVTISSGGTTKTLNLGGTSTGNSVGGAISNGIGTLSLTKSNTGIWELSGLSAAAVDNYSGATIIDNGTLRITTTNPSFAGSLTFGSSVGGTNTGSLDLSSASATFAGAFLARTNSTNANTITIGSGRTLQLNGAFTVGYNNTALPHSTTGLNVTGSGTLSIGTSGTPTNANVQIGNGATTSVGNFGVLDMSGLANFYANLGSGSFRVGSPTNGGSANGGGSTVVLAADSTIQAATLLLGSPDGSANGGDTAVQSLKLGSGINVINVNAINLGGIGSGDGRSNGSLTFNGATGSLKVRSQADPINGRPNLNVGVINQNTSVGQIHNLFDTTGHTADLRFGTMNLGFRTLGTGSTTAQFNFDAGTLDANDLTAGSRGGSAGADATATGIVTFGGGTVTINAATAPIQLGINTLGSGTAAGTLNISGGSVTVAANGGNSIRLGNASAASGTANGTINLTGGTLTVAGDIIRGDTAGTSNATVNLSGGSLNMNGHDLGAAGNGMVSFHAEAGVLQNIASINGTGGLLKSTSGTLVLQSTNTYGGSTTISGGTLVLGSSGAVPATPLSIGNATLDAADFTNAFGTLEVTAAAVINLGSGASLAFANSSAINWPNGTLTITGNFVSGSSLRFGTTSNALSADQLAKISNEGFINFSLNSSGYLVADVKATFESWQFANGATGTFDSDHDSDGVSDGIEYFLGGDGGTTGTTLLPGVLNDNGTLSITWTKSGTYPGTYGADFTVETCDTLTGTWTTEILGGNVMITGNNVKYTFPGGPAYPGKKFARLRVAGP